MLHFVMFYIPCDFRHYFLKYKYVYDKYKNYICNLSGIRSHDNQFAFRRTKRISGKELFCCSKLLLSFRPSSAKIRETVEREFWQKQARPALDYLPAPAASLGRVPRNAGR
jgi:hypothetical protein